MNSSIYINGKLVGGHPYGYTSFFCDATQAIIPGKKNIIAVRVDNSQQKNCRWYSGSGIYRHVWLIHTPKLYIGNWGVQIHTPQISDTEATVEINTLVKNETNHNKKIKVVTQLSGTSQANTIVTIAANSEQRVKQLLHVKSPKLWNQTSPHLYEAQISICENNKVIDNYSQKFGIRSIRYSNKGFLLNGKKLNITGGCLHHDNGILTGQGSLAAMGNANIKDTDSYVNNTHKTWKGRALVIVRSSHKKGKAALSIKADGIKGATVSLRIK